MIYIYKDSVNNVYFRGQKMSSKSYFVFDFQSVETNESKLMTGVNYNSGSTNYDLFVIIETGSTYQNLTASTINLGVGTYNLYIYDADAQHLMATGTCIEKNVVIVSSTTASTFSYYMPMSGATIVQWD